MLDEYVIRTSGSQKTGHYHIGWMKEHPLVIGFMERPIEIINGKPAEAMTRMLAPPYHTSIMKMCDEYADMGAKFLAPLYAQTLIEDVNDSPREILFLRYSVG